jgi:hypothetical protein
VSPGDTGFGADTDAVNELLLDGCDGLLLHAAAAAATAARQTHNIERFMTYHLRNAQVPRKHASNSFKT